MKKLLQGIFGPKKKIGRTPEEEKLLTEYIKTAKEHHDANEPIYRGCSAAGMGGCFCTGACKEIIGYKPRTQNPFETITNK